MHEQSPSLQAHGREQRFLTYLKFPGLAWLWGVGYGVLSSSSWTL